MTREEFIQEARNIMASKAPWLPVGEKVKVSDADRYTQLKNAVQEKIYAIDAPDIDVNARIEIIASIENELDEFIRNNHKRGDK